MHVNCFLYSFWYLCHITTSSILLLSTISWIAGIQGQEMSRRKTSNVCRNSTECPVNAFCEKFNESAIHGQCICHKGYIIIAENRRRECYEAARTINDPCIYHEQCMITLSTESECRNGFCQCQHGAHFVERKNTCYKSVRVGDYCVFTNNCVGEGTVCRSGTCHCPYGKHPRYDLMDCIQDVQLGEKCTSSEECVVKETRCDRGICRCKANHVISKSGDRCLKVAKRLHDECEEDQQCLEQLPYTHCDSNKNNTCVCKDGYHEMNYVSILSFGNYNDKADNFSTHVGLSVKFQKCWVSVPLGGLCEADENCAAVDFTICKNGRCICHDGFENVGGYCSSGIKLASSIIKLLNQRFIALIVIISYLFIVI